MTIDEFKKLDLRVGKIIEAEKVENSEKLVKLVVDIGDEKRQIVAGISKAYAMEELFGREIVILTNLESRKLMGLESQGMLLAAHGSENEPVILTVEREVPPGSKIS